MIYDLSLPFQMANAAVHQLHVPSDNAGTVLLREVLAGYEQKDKFGRRKSAQDKNLDHLIFASFLKRIFTKKKEI